MNLICRNYLELVQQEAAAWYYSVAGRNDKIRANALDKYKEIKREREIRELINSDYILYEMIVDPA